MIDCFGKQLSTEIGVVAAPAPQVDPVVHRGLGGRAEPLLAAGFLLLARLLRLGFLADFLSRVPDEGEYAAVGERLELTSHAVAVAVARLRERYRALIRAEVADTVDSPADVDAELHHLVELVSR